MLAALAILVSISVVSARNEGTTPLPGDHELLASGVSHTEYQGDLISYELTAESVAVVRKPAFAVFTVRGNNRLRLGKVRIESDSSQTLQPFIASLGMAKMECQIDDIELSFRNGQPLGNANATALKVTAKLAAYQPGLLSLRDVTVDDPHGQRTYGAAIFSEADGSLRTDAGTTLRLPPPGGER
jgi:hypothetical protein